MCFSNDKKTEDNVAPDIELINKVTANPILLIFAGKSSDINVHTRAPGASAKKTI